MAGVEISPREAEVLELIGAHLSNAEIAAGLCISVLLSSRPISPAGTHELIDALGIVTESGLGAGDVPGARRWARQLADHPSLAEVGHRATCRLLMVDALAGNVDEVLTGSVRILDAWRRAGSPARSLLCPAVAAVAMIHGLRDDHDARREWQEVLFDAAGCRYQSLRTLVLAGGDHAERGAAALADLGLAPMAPGPTPMMTAE